MLWSSRGVLDYRKSSLVLNIDQGLVEYYRSLIPRYKGVSCQAHRAHITLIRSFERCWLCGIISGEYNFVYSGEILFSFPYYYLRCWGSELNEIRRSWGLGDYRFGYSSFHITLGNVKSPE